MVIYAFAAFGAAVAALIVGVVLTGLVLGSERPPKSIDWDRVRSPLND
jgi:hypothetical protein